MLKFDSSSDAVSEAIRIYREKNANNAVSVGHRLLRELASRFPDWDRDAPLSRSFRAKN
jgi:hypothetical protein